MTPTNELRFVERKKYTIDAGEFLEVFTVRVLQQKWVHAEHGYHADIYTEEWRDVPLVKG